MAAARPRSVARIAGASGEKDGVGLGLFLMREIIRKHGGDIRYEAKEEGSDFILNLPK